jgi:hypothetical protein
LGIAPAHGGFIGRLAAGGGAFSRGWQNGEGLRSPEEARTMRRIATRKLTLSTLAVLLVAAGATVLITSGGSRSATTASARTLALRSNAPRAAGTQAVASRYLGLSNAQLRSQLRAGKSLAQIAEASNGRSAAGLIDAVVRARTARLHAARAAGRISAGRESRALASLRRRVTEVVDRVRAPSRSQRLVVETAASYLGLSAQQLRGELASGRTLAQIAGTRPGRSAAGLVSTLVNTRRAMLEELLAATRRRESKEQARLSTLQQRVSTLVNRRFPAGR